MAAPKCDGTEWFCLCEGGKTSVPTYALPVPGGVVLAVSNNAILLPLTTLEGDPETGYHLKSALGELRKMFETAQSASL